MNKYNESVSNCVILIVIFCDFIPCRNAAVHCVLFVYACALFFSLLGTKLPKYIEQSALFDYTTQSSASYLWQLPLLIPFSWNWTAFRRACDVCHTSKVEHCFFCHLIGNTYVPFERIFGTFFPCQPMNANCLSYDKLNWYWTVGNCHAFKIACFMKKRRRCLQ